MKILICDYADALEADYSVTINTVKEIVKEDVTFEIFPWTTEEDFLERAADANGLITGFLPMQADLLKKVSHLSCISISASGYGMIDLDAAKSEDISICHIFEYCTNEVAEHTMALMLALTKQLKPYTSLIEKEKDFSYFKLPPQLPMFEHTLAIFGLGKIGQAVAKRAQAFGMKVLAYDPHLPPEVATSLGVELVSMEEALSRATIITNHMILNEATANFFAMSTFEQMTQKPFFINVGRGAQVVEEDLAKALDLGLLSGAGLDVLSSEHPDLTDHPLCDRENVILTPHAAFYSSASIEKLQSISASNLAYCLTNQSEKASRRLV